MNSFIVYVVYILVCIICFQLGVFSEYKRIDEQIFVKIKNEEEALEQAWQEGWNACEKFYQQEKHGS